MTGPTAHSVPQEPCTIYQLRTHSHVQYLGTLLSSLERDLSATVAQCNTKVPQEYAKELGGGMRENENTT
jgi:hypothetical protein